MSRTRRTAFALQGKTDSARAFEVTLQDCSRVLPACLPTHVSLSDLEFCYRCRYHGALKRVHDMSR